MITLAAAWVCAACVCGCASAPHPAASPGASGPPPPAPESARPADDWRPLIVAPFGTLLKDMPLALDEVLMFSDAAASGAAERGAAERGPADRGAAERGAAERGPAERGAAERGPAERGAAERGPAEPAASGAPNEPESGDCFSLDRASPPQFLARRPDSYLLCFEHDRLRRIEASVHLAAAEAEPLLGALCAQWLGRAQDAARTPDGCAGRDGAVEWRVRSAHGPESSATLSITLIDARPVPRE